MDTGSSAYVAASNQVRTPSVRMVPQLPPPPPVTSTLPPTVRRPPEGFERLLSDPGNDIRWHGRL